MEAIDYLSGAFVTEAAELDKVRRVAAEARETLERFADDGAWPYEVVQRHMRSARKPEDIASNSISHSTSAMILFALGVACGRIRSSTLAPFVEPLSGKAGIEAQSKFDAELRSYITILKRGMIGSPPQPWHWKSGTFGEEDSFTLLWLLEIFRDLRGTVDADLRADARDGYALLVEFAERRVRAAFRQEAEPWNEAFDKKHHEKNELMEHAFPTLRIVQLYDHLRAAAIADGAAQKKAAADDERSTPSILELGSDYILRYLHNRLHLHLSYSVIPDSSYDPAELAFTMEALLLINSDSIDAATVERCRHVLVDTQQRNSYWRPLRPFLATPQGMTLLPLSVETANSLVRSCEILARRERSRADRSGDAKLFEQYTKWIFGRIVRGTATATIRGAETKEKFAGWRSEHADDRGKVHLWETSQVLVYLMQYESFLRSYRAERALHCMNLKVTHYPVTMAKRHEQPLMTTTPLEAWAKDASEPLTDVQGYTFTDAISENFIEPRSDDGTRKERSYSILLYGPQGTGKTFLAERIAESLGLPLISISPSDFMVSGDSLVEARAKQLFDVLQAQPSAVILLDEIDRLILDRTSDVYGKQSDPFQLMTPGMLTKLHDLRDEARSIFIISTNYAERIDPAIKRTGRIDAQYLVVPPDKRRRAYVLRDRLDRIEHFPKHLLPPVEALVDGVPEAALWVFGELKKLANAVADAARKDDWNSARWTPEHIVHELNRLAAERPPTIRLGAYVSRFEKDNLGAKELSPEQKPYEEALMLLYLVAEVIGRPIKDDERRLWSTILGTAKKDGSGDTPEKVVEYVRNRDVRKTILQAFQYGSRT